MNVNETSEKLSELNSDPYSDDYFLHDSELLDFLNGFFKPFLNLSSKNGLKKPVFNLSSKNFINFLIYLPTIFSVFLALASRNYLAAKNYGPFCTETQTVYVMAQQEMKHVGFATASLGSSSWNRQSKGAFNSGASSSGSNQNLAHRGRDNRTSATQSGESGENLAQSMEQLSMQDSANAQSAHLQGTQQALVVENIQQSQLIRQHGKQTFLAGLTRNGQRAVAEGSYILSLETTPLTAISRNYTSVSRTVSEAGVRHDSNKSEIELPVILDFLFDVMNVEVRAQLEGLNQEYETATQNSKTTAENYRTAVAEVDTAMVNYRKNRQSSECSEATRTTRKKCRQAKRSHKEAVEAARIIKKNINDILTPEIDRLHGDKLINVAELKKMCLQEDAGAHPPSASPEESQPPGNRTTLRNRALNQILSRISILDSPKHRADHFKHKQMAIAQANDIINRLPNGYSDQQAWQLVNKLGPEATKIAVKLFNRYEGARAAEGATFDTYTFIQNQSGLAARLLNLKPDQSIYEIFTTFSATSNAFRDNPLIG